MNMPNFTAETSLYRTTGRYRTSGSSGFSDPQHSQSVTLAYGPSSHAACDDCLMGCVESYFVCLATTLSLGCFARYLACVPRCEFGPACCPKRCNFELGEGRGCCDADEQCVDINSPQANTRTAGCCPGDQIVCAGTCCAKGASCCDEICCPPGFFCRDGLFCEREFPGRFPTTPAPSLPPLNKWCKYFGGFTSCGRGCCPPGTECCGALSDGRPDCMPNCLT